MTLPITITITAIAGDQFQAETSGGTVEAGSLRELGERLKDFLAGLEDESATDLVELARLSRSATDQATLLELAWTSPPPDAWVTEVAPSIPPGILQSQQAFWRDLPHLLSQPKLQGRWVCYQGGVRIGIGAYEELIREYLRHGIPDDGSYLARIRPRELPPWEPEEIEPLGPQHQKDERIEP